MIADNLTAIRMRIQEAAARSGRTAEGIRVVAAAKGQGRARILEALGTGIAIIGHNYVQEAALEALPKSPPGSEFHMIGHLQTNKAGKAVELFDVIETVDDARLAEALHRRSEALGRTPGVMVQVNLAGEVQKSGIESDRVEALVSSVRALPCLKLMGLMTMPPFFDDPEAARPYFAALRRLRDRLMESGVLAAGMGELSMGMTGDFEAAVEEGATLVRIGTALFGPRA